MSVAPELAQSIALDIRPFPTHEEYVMENREMLVGQAMVDATLLLGSRGVETPMAEGAGIARSCTVEVVGRERPYAFMLEQQGTTTDNQDGRAWQEEIVFSVLLHGHKARWVTLTPGNFEVTSPFEDNRVWSDNDAGFFSSAWATLRITADAQRHLNVYLARIAAAKTGATPEAPQTPMPTDIARRLQLVSDIRGVQQISATSHDGPIYEVTADLGHTTEVVENPADGNEAGVRHVHFSTTYAHATRGEVGFGALPDSILITVDGIETRYRISPNGDLSPLIYDPNNAEHSPEAIQHRVAQLGQHLERMIEEGQYNAAVRDRVAMFMDRVQARQNTSDQPAYHSNGPVRIGEDEVDLSIQEHGNHYEVNLGMISPDGQPPYVRQLVVPKDRRRAAYETSVNGRKYTRIEDLVDAALDRALHPQTATTQREVAREGNEYHQAYLTVDEMLTDAGARVVYGRSEEIGPHISRVQWHTIFGPNGERYLIQRFGRLGEHGQIDWLYTRVQQGFYPAYELTRNGFIPTKAYRGGVTPRMTRRQREIAEAEFEDFAAALEFHSKQTLAQSR